MWKHSRRRRGGKMRVKYMRGEPLIHLNPSYNVPLLGKMSIPLGGRNFLLRRSGKGLDKVEKGWEGHVMLRGSLSNLYSIILHPLTHYYNFYVFDFIKPSN